MYLALPNRLPGFDDLGLRAARPVDLSKACQWSGKNKRREEHRRRRTHSIERHDFPQLSSPYQQGPKHSVHSIASWHRENG